MNLNVSFITGSWKGADPDVVAPHFYVVNLVAIFCKVLMVDETSRLGSDQTFTVERREKFLVGTLLGLGYDTELDFRTEDSIANRFT
jgi:hypothetical protein